MLCIVFIWEKKVSPLSNQAQIDVKLRKEKKKWSVVATVVLLWKDKVQYCNVSGSSNKTSLTPTQPRD